MESERPPETEFKRQFTRYNVKIQGRLAVNAGMSSVSVTNLSGGGAGLQFQPALRSILLNSELSLVLEEFGWLPSTVRWMSADKCGVSFEIAPDRKQAIASTLAEKFDRLG